MQMASVLQDALHPGLVIISVIQRTLNWNSTITLCKDAKWRAASGITTIVDIAILVALRSGKTTEFVMLYVSLIVVPKRKTVQVCSPNEMFSATISVLLSWL